MTLIRRVRECLHAQSVDLPFRLRALRLDVMGLLPPILCEHDPCIVRVLNEQGNRFPLLFEPEDKRLCAYYRLLTLLPGRPIPSNRTVERARRVHDSVYLEGFTQKELEETEAAKACWGKNWRFHPCALPDKPAQALAELRGIWEECALRGVPFPEDDVWALLTTDDSLKGDGILPRLGNLARQAMKGELYKA